MVVLLLEVLILMRKFADKVLILMIYFTLISVAIDVLALSLKRAAKKMLQEETLQKNC